ncbi:MAG: AbrB/MazE/SpoVT family DNA-binding domain-containing protein [Candidatus Omnitrophica bacterium]|nr:AbrB/MazE/SpoVT family DNA-binding domain-containing protein [Candidatus Omnitrophota bacterium]
MQPFFRSKAYGAVTVGGRGQLVIPAELRKSLEIKSGDQLMVFGKLEKKAIILIPAEDFSRFLEKAARVISSLEKKIPKKKK